MISSELVEFVEGRFARADLCTPEKAPDGYFYSHFDTAGVTPEDAVARMREKLADYCEARASENCDSVWWEMLPSVRPNTAGEGWLASAALRIGKQADADAISFPFVNAPSTEKSTDIPQADEVSEQMRLSNNILHGAVSKLDSVVVIGVTPGGEMHFGVNAPSAAHAVYLAERFKLHMLTASGS